jgi:TM2 domain-containing membrane protein YozV
MEEKQFFCDKCGNRAGSEGTGYSSPPHLVYVKEKSTGLATVLSMVWMGLGQLYVGKVGRGLALMLLQFIMIFVAGAVILVGTFFGGLGGFLIGNIVFFGAWVAVWIWNVFNSHKLANEYNNAARVNGRPW